MGEEQGELKGLEFNAAIRVEAGGERLTDNAGAVLVREALERSGMLSWLDERLVDSRDPERVTHPQRELLATLITMFALGWRDQDDADVLRRDPVMRLAVSERAGDSPLRDVEVAPGDRNPTVPNGLGSQPTLSRQVHRLASHEQCATLREGLLEQSGRRVRQANGGRRLAHVTMDVDGVPVEVAGHQPGALYHGHYGQTMYHPLVVTSAELGDLLDVRLRRGTAHSADGALEQVVDVARRARQCLARTVSVRMDAGMPSEDLLFGLEAERVPYTARIRNNSRLDALAKPYLKRPVGRPPTEPREWTHELTYKAEKWSRPRRAVLVVQERPDDLYLHHFWLVTSYDEERYDGAALLALYRHRGKAEGHFGELMDVLDPKLSSSPRGRFTLEPEFIGPLRPEDDRFFRANEALLVLNALAYNVMHAIRTQLDATETGDDRWSIKRVRERVLRVAGRITLHARRVVISITDATERHWRALWPRLAWLDDPGTPSRPALTFRARSALRPVLPTSRRSFGAPRKGQTRPKFASLSTILH